nr:hypothetical protein [Paracoccus aminovorans]
MVEVSSNRTNGPAIRKTCAQFVEMCRLIGLLKGDCVAIDGSTFKAVTNRDRNFTKIAAREALHHSDLHAIADKDYFSGSEIRASPRPCRAHPHPRAWSVLRPP